MKAFNNDPKIKEICLANLQSRYDFNNILDKNKDEKNPYLWTDDFKKYGLQFERGAEIGISDSVISLQEYIFRMLPRKIAKNWPLRFFSAIAPGADLANAIRLFLLKILSDEEHGCLKFTILGSSHNKVVELVINIIKTFQQFEYSKYINHICSCSALAAARMAMSLKKDASEFSKINSEVNKKWASELACNAAALAVYFYSVEPQENNMLSTDYHITKQEKAYHEHIIWMADVIIDLLQKATP